MSSNANENNKNQPSNNSQLQLPWGARKERQAFPSGANIETDVKPGEYVLRTLFAEFTIQAERKIDLVLSENLERPLSKSLQRGEDVLFDQLLGAFGSVAEHCLPSLLKTLFAWYEHQGVDYEYAQEQKLRSDSKSKADVPERNEFDYLHERRDLAVEFIFCLVLIEVLKQLQLHPGHEDLVSYIENLAFKHFKFKEGAQIGPNSQNVNIIADLYAEVIGVLAQSRFQSVRKCFTQELKDLRSKEANPITTHSIINLLMGMKFFRIKMVPIEEFEASFQFMQECATYFLEAKDKDIKHALAGLFVEILVPVAATVKNEVNVPCLKTFVEMVYPQTLDLCTKKKHSLALFPLVTCLLCVSQKSFFLQNWHYFLAMCLSHLKHRDPKMCRVALESLYRLLWVYMIRIKCESNTATQSRLQSIVHSLFPKGSKAVVPRDTPLNIFVKIIQFIAQERLDFAMKEIVFDLISVGRPIKIILTPERMNIGLRAFLVVADSLQQKEGDPPMPRTVGVLPSGNTLRVKKTFLNKMLTEATARTIGMSYYYPYVRKAFGDILKALDVQFGRPLMMTTVQNINKEPDDMITGERKPKIDLFRTCVAAVPRLIPDEMSRQELVDLLSRLTVHMDEELRGLAFQSLQNMMIDFPEWREDVIYGFVQFMLREVNDTYPQLLDNALRMLLQILTNWKNAIINSSNSLKKESREQSKLEHLANVLHYVEATALVMLCNCRQAPRRLAVHILKESKALLNFYIPPSDEIPVADAIDNACAEVVNKCLPFLPATERAAITSASNIDLQWLVERNSSAWNSSGIHETSEGENKIITESADRSNIDAWCMCLMGYMASDCVIQHCPTATAHSWPIVYAHITTLFNQLDLNPVNDNRASLLRPNTVKKIPTERDMYLSLWRNYLMFACRVAPPSNNLIAPGIRYFSPDLSISSSPDSLGSDKSDNRLSGANNVYSSNLFKQIVPHLRSEQADLKDSIVLGISYVNQHAIKDLMEELVILIREAIDRKQENMRRRRRRDVLRVHLAQVLESIAEQGTFGISASVLDRDACTLNTTFVEYIDGARLYLESENDKDVPAIVQDIKKHFCGFIQKLIKSFPLETRVNLLGNDLRRNLFYLFAGWSGRFGSTNSTLEKKSDKTQTITDFKFFALQAMSTVLCCGPSFDPPGLSEESPIYSWLNSLLCSTEDRLYQLGQETVVLLLEFNTDSGTLLDWVVDGCYTGNAQMADGCFNALATIFSVREYPCDHYMAIVNVTLLNTGCSRAHIQETALQLLQILYSRFFTLSNLSIDLENEQLSETNKSPPRLKQKANTFDSLFSIYPCTQIQLSKQMAHLHPELTMTIFSEITFRMQTATVSLQQNLLQYLLPWLNNMELVDPNMHQHNPLNQLGRIQEFCGRETRSVIERQEGWGSAEATEMVLNNLFYITRKFDDSHSKEIEDVWATLCSCWPNNLKVIIRYLFIITGLAPNELLIHAKKVILYMARAKSEKVLDELMADMQTVETLNCLIERTETPPFFRITNIRKGSSHSDDGGSNSTQTDVSRGELTLERGTLHTKRHSTESGCEKDSQILKEEPCIMTHSLPPEVQSSSILINAEDNIGHSTLGAVTIEEDGYMMMCNLVEEDHIKPDTPQPHPLPMPEYGGYYAPLTEFLPPSSLPVTSFHRCNLSVMLLADVVTDGIDIDWSPHIPLILHIIFLGLDHTRSLVHEHCKKLLLNLLIVMTQHHDHLSLAKILLNSKTQYLNYGLPTHMASKSVIEISPNLESSFDSSYESTKTLEAVPMEECSSPKEKGDYVTFQASPIKENNNKTDTLTETIKSLTDFLAAKKGAPLWNYEDITSKVWQIKSADQITLFLHHILFVFKESIPLAHIEDRWAQVALQLALSCSSRHYAGRSLQVFRALRVPLTARMLSDILSRLVETVSEQGEDMQGYVTELMLTLEAAVDSLDSSVRINDFKKEIFKSTPNLNKDPNRKNISNSLGNAQHASLAGIGHVRSTSYSMSYPGRKVIDPFEAKDNKNKSPIDFDLRTKNFNLGRSRSAQSLKMADDQYLQEDRLTLLSQLFWIAVSLLESDYEHEFLLALRLFEKVLLKLPIERADCQEKIDKVQMQLKWSNFPGVHSLILKGTTTPTTYEATINLLSQLTPILDVSVIDPSESLSFPFNVIALLPYLYQNYDDPNFLCIKSAENIAQVCMEKSEKLENLATVMTLYSRRLFSKESFQWTKCVVKYLHDAYSNIFLNLVSYLVEVLEKGPSNLQSHILSVLHCVLHYLDISSSAQAINTDLMRVVSRYIETPQWKDALKILKLVVTRSSTLAAPPTSINMSSSCADSVSIASVSFVESEFVTKRELPGRTMEFNIDISEIPVAGQKYQAKNKKEQQTHEDGTNKDDNTASPRRSLSHNHSFTENGCTGWRRPWLSQPRTREHLIGLLTSCGQRVGLPKSPSVIFSQSSDIIEHQSSMCSSTEEISAPNNDMSAEGKLESNLHPEQQFGVFKDFDFLEYELESQEGESMDNFNWGVRRRCNYDDSEDNDKQKSSVASHSNLSPRKEESSDDEMGSVSPLDDHLEIPSGNVSLVFPPSSLPLLDHGRRPSSPASVSLASDGDLTLSNTSPSFSPLATAAHLPPLHDEIEDIWRSHVHALMTDALGIQATSTYQLLAKLFKESFRKISRLTSECCQQFPMTDSFRLITSHFLTMLDILVSQAECPFIYLDYEVISQEMLEKQKMFTLEIQEHWETFLEKVEHTMECLDSMKSCIKLEAIGEANNEGSIEEHRVDLCRFLYKLHFQLLLLLESYCKLLNLLSSIPTTQLSVIDLSEPVNEIKQELVRAVEDTESDRLSPPPTHTEITSVTREDVEAILLESALSHKWNKAIKQLHSYRSMFPNSLFGSSEEDDTRIILSIFTRHLCENKQSYFIMTRGEHSLSDVCRQLMASSLQLSSLIHMLEYPATPERSSLESSLNKSEC